MLLFNTVQEEVFSKFDYLVEVQSAERQAVTL